VDVPTVVGFVPEDRHRDAVALDFTLYENVVLAGAGSRRGTIAWNAERVRTEQLMHEYDVRAPAASTTARTLSGGNQQKLVVGREMSVAPKALVVENPTRGLDVQATADVHERLRVARAQGTAIVVYSSDLDEVLALADRVVVLYGKRLLEVSHDRDSVGSAMVGRSGV
jgi:simple sugar transport system ATP-binding protein